MVCDLQLRGRSIGKAGTRLRRCWDSPGRDAPGYPVKRGDDRTSATLSQGTEKLGEAPASLVTSEEGVTSARTCEATYRQRPSAACTAAARLPTPTLTADGILVSE